MENHDKHLCKKCKYAGKASTIRFKGNAQDNERFAGESPIICDYIGHTGKSRMLICDAEDCTVYEPKKRQRNTIPWSVHQ